MNSTYYDVVITQDIYKSIDKKYSKDTARASYHSTEVLGRDNNKTKWRFVDRLVGPRLPSGSPPNVLRVCPTVTKESSENPGSRVCTAAIQ
jgi:hypothetical protein